MACVGFPEGAGTPAQRLAICGRDRGGDPADSCSVGGLGDGIGYMLACAVTIGPSCSSDGDVDAGTD